MTGARKRIKLLANLRSRPSVVVGDDDLRRRDVCAEKGKGESKGAHSFEPTKEGAPGVWEEGGRKGAGDRSRPGESMGGTGFIYVTAEKGVRETQGSVASRRWVMSASSETRS